VQIAGGAGGKSGANGHGNIDGRERTPMVMKIGADFS
jgi:hypothetical protein